MLQYKNYIQFVNLASGTATGYSTKDKRLFKGAGMCKMFPGLTI